MAKNEDANLERFKEYFQDAITELNIEFNKSKEYSLKIDREIKKYDEIVQTGRGNSQHYLVEHIKNAIALQTQRQSIIKDKFSIKKAVLDYSIKSDAIDNDSSKNIFEEITKMVDFAKLTQASNLSTTKISEEQHEEIDDQIDAAAELPDED